MQINEFLSVNKLTPQSFDMEELCNACLNAMDNELPMIDSFCTPSAEIEAGKPVIVIDAGGTNFRTCLISFDKESKPVVTDFHKRTMPGSDREVSAEEFFSIIADETERLITKSDYIGFCFSYAAKILPNHDGVPLMFSKEIKAPQVIGKHLGEELFAEFRRRGIDTSNKKIIILNDTVTTLLAGLSETSKLGCEGCVGFILGTGTNTALIKNRTIINTESGCMTLSLGPIDREFINSTKDPDKYGFEKMISGAYLGPTVRLILEHAKKDGVLSDSFVVPDSLETKDIFTIEAGSEDSRKVQIIVENFVQRAAKLTAANLAASILYTDFGAEKPVLINADGTTFYKVNGLEENTKKFLDEYLSSKGRRAVFTQVENSPAIGAAIGALSLR